MKKIIYCLILITTFIINGCDTYKDFDVEYSPSYPMCGEYQVRDFDLNMNVLTSDYYNLTIYSSSIDTEKYIWINNVNHGLDPYNNSYKVKTEYNLDALTFDCSLLPNIPTGATPQAVPSRYISIEASKIMLNEWPALDSIIFKVTEFNSLKEIDTVFYTSGHRRSGFETPTFDI